MQKFIFAITTIALFSLNSLSQDVDWTEQHLEIINKYGLEKNDHRGIVFIFQQEISCDTEYSTVHLAIEAYLESISKKDLTSYCITDDEKFINYNGQPLDLFQIVSIYLQKED